MQKRKLAFIDSLRGIAALYVLFYHLPLITSPPAHVPGWLAPIVAAGGSAVILFFVISAFTLCLSMDVRHADDKHMLLDYAIRRLFRIAPLFFAWTAASIVMDRDLHGVRHSAKEIVENVLFVFNFSPTHVGGITPGAWTIGVEMLFYVCLPFLFRLADNIGKAAALFIVSLLLRMAWHAFVMAAISDPAVREPYFAMSFLIHLPTFLLGIVVYRITEIADMRTLAARGVGYGLVATFLYVILTWVYAPLAFDQTSALTVQALIYALLFLGLYLNPVPVFVNRVFGFYGKISFSVYLSHMVVIQALSPVIARFYAGQASVGIAYAEATALVLAVVTGVALVTYHLIERPGNAAGRKLIAAIERTFVTQRSRELAV